MKIAVFTNTYLPSVNGVVNSIEAFRKGLKEAGHTMCVFAPGARGHADDGGTVFRYPAISTARYADYPVALPFSRRVRNALRELEVDVVHTQHPFWVGNWGLRFARRHGIPVITTVHTQYELYAHYGRPIPPSLLRGPLRRAVRLHCQQCDVVATPGIAMKGYLKELGVTRPVEVAPNATDLAGFDTARGDAVRERYGIAHNEVLFIFVGRAAREKSLDRLICAFVIVAGKLPQARLMIVGGGPALDEVRRVAAAQPCAGRIILTGPVPYEHVRKYHAAGDVFALASVTEVQPLSLNEAMAARKPIVGFDAGGVNDMVAHDETGLLVSPADGEEGLARAMLELGADKEKRNRLGEAAKQASLRYHIPNATRRLVEVYEMAIREHASGSRRV